MKSEITFLYVLVSICLVFSLAALLLIAQNNGLFNPTPVSSTGRYTTNPATPTPTPNTEGLSLTATESKTDLGNDRIQVTYNINAQYTGNNNITLSYTQFYLELYAPRTIIYMYIGNVYPENNGTINLNPSHASQTYQVTFQFGTQVSNGMDQTTAVYQLKFNGTATTNWPQPYP